MLLTVLGLLITAAVAIEGAVTGTKNPRLKILLIALTAFGFAVACVSAEQDKKAAEAHTTEVQNHWNDEKQKFADAKQQLASQGKLIALVNQTVGDLGTLNRLTNGEKYYVRIAAGSKGGMESYLDGIEKKFKGARSSGLIAVRPLRTDCNPAGQHRSRYALVFGSNLDPAAAEVFERFADENGFPPPSQHASMEPEPKQP